MTYREECHLAEIDIRGRFITMACDLEFTLLQIMVNLAPDPHDHFRSFNRMMMNGKIQNTIADIKTYRPDLYEKYESDLLCLWEFKTIRNDLCHYRMEWPNTGDLKSFVVVYVVIDERNVETLARRTYTIDFLSDRHRKYSRLNITLLALLNEIIASKQGKV